MPKVSVIIPTHDRPDLVAGAVSSVLHQTYYDLELFVIDVGVRARAKNALAPFMSDPRFHYVENPIELRGGAARNIGASLAQGDYLAFLDDDDVWLPEKLAIQMKALDHAPSDVGFSFTAVTNDFGGGKEEATLIEDGVRDYGEISYVRFKGFLTVTLVIRRDVFNAVGGFDEQLPSHQDPELILRIAQKWKGLGINRPLVRVNMQAGHEHVGGSVIRRIMGREMLIAKHLPEFEKRPNILAKHYFWLGLRCREVGQMKKAKAYFLKAAWISKNPRYLFHALRVWRKTDVVS